MASCLASCNAGYVYTQIARPIRGAPSPSGSLLYTQADAWTPQPWSRPTSPAGLAVDYAIESLATTSELSAATLTDVYHEEYAFWTVRDPQWPYVFAQSLTSTPATAQWEVFGGPLDMAGNRYTLGPLAVSRWTVPRAAQVYVAALYTVAGGSRSRLIMSVNQFGAGGWAQEGMLNATLYTGSIPANVVSISHTCCSLGSSARVGYFYMAYNLGNALCGGLLLVSPSNINSPQSFSSNVCGSDPTVILEGFTVHLDPVLGMPIAYVMKGGGSLYMLDPQLNLLQSKPLIPSAPLQPGLVSLSSKLLLAPDSGGRILAADSTEWTWVPIQGMPLGTSAPTFSTTDLSPTQSLLVVGFGDLLFSITVRQCAPGSYWDGSACTLQSCMKTTACAGNMQLGANNECVCMPDFYQNPQMACVQCQSPNYCSNGVQKACPANQLTSTLYPQSTSANDCICTATSAFFSVALASCVRCPVNTWCPNQWSVYTCPGTAAVGAGTSNEFPVTCTCQGGFTGPGCQPCPDSYYCPTGTSSKGVNMAVYYVGVPASATESIRQSLFKYFLTQGSRVASVNTLQDLDAILLVSVVDATNHTEQGLMVMVQLPDAQITGWGLLLQLILASQSNTSSSITMSPSNGIPIQQPVSINPPTQCITGKVPSSPVASTCVCAPGYEPAAQQCSPCAINAFKADAGGSKCVQCAVGSVATNTGSTACVAVQDTGGTSGGGVSTGLLVGAVSGGVVGLVLLLFLLRLLIH